MDINITIFKCIKMIRIYSLFFISNILHYALFMSKLIIPGGIAGTQTKIFVGNKQKISLSFLL